MFYNPINQIFLSLYCVTYLQRHLLDMVHLLGKIQMQDFIQRAGFLKLLDIFCFVRNTVHKYKTQLKSKYQKVVRGNEWAKHNHFLGYVFKFPPKKIKKTLATVFQKLGLICFPSAKFCRSQKVSFPAHAKYFHGLSLLCMFAFTFRLREQANSAKQFCLASSLLFFFTDLYNFSSKKKHSFTYKPSRQQ